MKQIKKHAFMGVILSGILAISMVTLQAHAQTQTTTTSYPMPMAVTIDGSGNALIRGVVQTTGKNSVTIKSWGGSDWTIVTTNNSAVTSAGSTGGVLTGINNGDFIGARGTVDQNAVMTINAQHVTDWTASKTAGSALSSSQTLYAGTATNIGNSSFTLTDQNGNTYTVTTGNNTKVWNTARSTISLSDIQANDTVRVDGTLSGTTITPSIIRDTSR